MEEHRIKRRSVIGLISEADLARNLGGHELAEFVAKVHATP
jgi:hypothetical protein